MLRALQIAKMGEGRTSPNPMVGAVIVHKGKIIGEGYHRTYGTPHAEVNAINSVKDKTLLNDSIMYVTLEPCSHYGKTPPCCDLIIAQSIPHVVIGTLDPFEKVSGRGVRKLREAGVNVEVGMLEKECIKLNEKFITAHSLHRPHILLKWAQSIDGYIDKTRTNRGEQAIISTPLTTMWTHHERSLCDAIMVGSRTVILDNPSLTVRNWHGDNPLRVIIDTKGAIPSDSKIFNDGNKSLIFTSTGSYHQAETNPNVDICILNTSEDYLLQVFKELYHRNITSIMVEGGAILLQTLIDNNLWDEARIETGSTTFHSGVAAPKISGDLISVLFHGESKTERFHRS